VDVFKVNDEISLEKILEMAEGRLAVAYDVPSILHFNVLESPINVTYAKAVFKR